MQSRAGDIIARHTLTRINRFDRSCHNAETDFHAKFVAVIMFDLSQSIQKSIQTGLLRWLINARIPWLPLATTVIVLNFGCLSKSH